MTGDFIELLERLHKAGVDFVIVGGFAGTVYGCMMVTQDVDICLDFSPANLLALQRAICDSHPVHRMTPSRQKLELTEKNCSSFKNLYLDTDIGRLDCLGSIEGVGDYQKVKEESVMIETDGVRLRVLNLDALIESKKAMNRPRDRQAIAELEAIKKLRKGKK
jgi:predicted nucleotidyltransferase